jgi:membrane protease YdiL (CAAX protease family)
MSRAASAKSPAARSRRGSWFPIRLPKADGYFRRSELPLHSLAFLLPLIVTFEAATYFYPSETIAYRSIQKFFGGLGATGRFLPALSIVAILLAIHIARKDSWKIDVRTLWLMGVESIALALPLVAVAMAISRWQAGASVNVTGVDWRNQAILSLGAGIYEELVFRLVTITLLNLLLIDICKLPETLGYVLMVVISAVLFALYHYLGSETFNIRSFVFRTMAGVYFAAIFVSRGFGITAGAHAAYDVLIATLIYV